jgi:hypothetical protein
VLIELGLVGLAKDRQSRAANEGSFSNSDGAWVVDTSTGSTPCRGDGEYVCDKNVNICERPVIASSKSVNLISESAVCSTGQ